MAFRLRMFIVPVIVGATALILHSVGFADGEPPEGPVPPLRLRDGEGGPPIPEERDSDREPEPSPYYRSRSGATKDATIKTGGGNSATEAAVARGLLWLSGRQKADGSWGFDGTSRDTIAATGMALLPFLAVGETHKSGKKYQKTVAAGVDYLLARLDKSGTFGGSSGMYAHAIATTALCEAWGMTEDTALKVRAQSLLDYIVAAQADDGSWGYMPKVRGDTSVVGWQIHALHAGRFSRLTVPAETFKKADEFLESVSGSGGTTYGYTAPGSTPSLDPVGLLSRCHTGWGPKEKKFVAGVEKLLEDPPAEPKPGVTPEMYRMYNATRAVYLSGLQDCYEVWNPKMQHAMLGSQLRAPGPNKGSWNPDSGLIGTSCGRLGTTCLAVLTLEVYYRYPSADRLERGEPFMGGR